MSTSILKAKTTVPQFDSRMVSRAALCKWLDSASTRPLTLISAPAGFGKTTLVNEWATSRASINRIAWLSLDSSEADPVRFFHYVVACLQKIDPDIGKESSLVLERIQSLSITDFEIALINELMDSDRVIVLVLEDYHLISNAETDAALTYLIEYIPEQLRLIITTRNEPDFPLVRWRSHLRVSELGADELRFTFGDIQEFLRRTMQLELNDNAIQKLEGRTEGWITGLQIAALTLKNMRIPQQDVEFRIAELSDRSCFMMEYFASEVLRHQPVEIQEFLRKTSVLDRFSPELCTAIGGWKDAKNTINYLFQSNIFLMPLDQECIWFRYHQLFSDYLRSLLSSAEMHSLHRSASAWYEAHNMADEAIRHAVLAEDFPAVIKIFRANVQRLLSRGDVRSLLGWIDVVPEDLLRSETDLVWYKIWLLYLSGRNADAQSFQERLGINNVSEVPLRDGMSFVYQSYLALNWGDPKQAQEPARLALEYFGNDPSFFRGYALTLLGQSNGLSGDLTAAAEAHTQEFNLCKGLGNDLMRLDALCHLSPLLSAQGRLREAILLCRDETTKYVNDQHEPLPISGMVHVPLGSLLYEANDLPAARLHLTTGVALAKKLGMIYLIVLGQQHLARLLHAAGEREEAWTVLAEACEIAERPPSPRRQRLIGAVSAELQLREGNLCAAERTISELKKLPGVASMHELLVHARLLIAQHKQKNVHSILGLLERRAHAQKLDGYLIAVHVLQALFNRSIENHSAARMQIATAVSLASTAGYRRVFVEHGPALTGLLESVRQEAPSFVDELLRSISLEWQDLSIPKQLIERLTKTELEALVLLDRGLTNQEVAEYLGITLATAKWHLGNIFGKLQVRNRTEAISKARQFKLL